MSIASTRSPTSASLGRVARPIPTETRRSARNPQLRPVRNNQSIRPGLAGPVRRPWSSSHHRVILGGTMSPNMELVRRWYALLPSLGGSDPNDDSAFFDRIFRDYLDEEYELRLPGGYPEGEPAFRGREWLAQ